MHRECANGSLLDWEGVVCKAEGIADEGIRKGRHEWEKEFERNPALLLRATWCHLVGAPDFLVFG
jgi:hypothetical protein